MKYPKHDEKCSRCGHTAKAHRWRPYGSAPKYLRCHIKRCRCWFFENSLDNPDEKDSRQQNKDMICSAILV